jgi:hypothetical protein
MPDLHVAATQAVAAVLHSDMNATAGAWHIQVNESPHTDRISTRTLHSRHVELSDLLPRDDGLSFPRRPTTLKRPSYHGDKQQQLLAWRVTVPCADNRNSSAAIASDKLEHMRHVTFGWPDGMGIPRGGRGISGGLKENLRPLRETRCWRSTLERKIRCRPNQRPGTVSRFGGSANLPALPFADIYASYRKAQ